MDEGGWLPVDDGDGEALWRRFAATFGFRAGTTAKDWPAIREPVPSVTYGLGPFTGERMAAVARLVADVLRAVTRPEETVVFHDWVHPSSRLLPHRLTDEGPLFPNGDYAIAVAEDLRFGVLGHPWERSLCFFGAAAVDAVDRLNRGTLTAVLRRDGTPSSS
jgi:hypothetical protein